MASPPAEQEPTRQLNVRLPAGLVSWAESYSQNVISPSRKRAANQGAVSALVELLLLRERLLQRERHATKVGQGEG